MYPASLFCRTQSAEEESRIHSTASLLQQGNFWYTFCGSDTDSLTNTLPEALLTGSSFIIYSIFGTTRANILCNAWPVLWDTERSHICVTVLYIQGYYPRAQLSGLFELYAISIVKVRWRQKPVDWYDTPDTVNIVQLTMTSATRGPRSRARRKSWKGFGHADRAISWVAAWLFPSVLPNCLGLAAMKRREQQISDEDLGAHVFRSWKAM